MFQVHTIESAPADSTASLQALEQRLGFVPNLAATMAESPALISGFVDLRKTLANGELNGVEREIVALAVSLENDCDYCMAAHSTFALSHTTLANLAHSISKAPLDDAFKPQAWLADEGVR